MASAAGGQGGVDGQPGEGHHRRPPAGARRLFDHGVRSSMAEQRGVLLGVDHDARRRPRRTGRPRPRSRSTWPLCRGSKLPGYRTRTTVMCSWLDGLATPGRRRAPSECDHGTAVAPGPDIIERAGRARSARSDSMTTHLGVDGGEQLGPPSNAYGGSARQRSTAAGWPRQVGDTSSTTTTASVGEPRGGQVGPDRPQRPAGVARRTCSGARPRDSASMPSAPEPANRSSTVAPVDRAEAVQAVEQRPRARGRWSAGCAAPGGATSPSPRRPGHDPHRRRDRQRGRLTATGCLGSCGMSAVRVVRIDQGHVRNAINAATAQRLHDEFLAFEADDDAKVAVLYGDERAFCAGANLTRPPDAAAERAARPDPPAALQAGHRRHRGLVRRRRLRAGRVVRPARVRRGRPLRLPRAALGRARWSTAAPTACPGSSAWAAPSTSSSPAASSTPPRPTTSASPTGSCPTATRWPPRSPWPSRSPRSRGPASSTTGRRSTRASGSRPRRRARQRGPPRPRVIFAPGFADGVARFSDRRR